MASLYDKELISSQVKVVGKDKLLLDTSPTQTNKEDSITSSSPTTKRRQIY